VAALFIIAVVISRSQYGYYVLQDNIRLIHWSRQVGSGWFKFFCVNYGDRVGSKIQENGPLAVVY